MEEPLTKADFENALEGVTFILKIRLTGIVLAAIFLFSIVR